MAGGVGHLHHLAGPSTFHLWQAVWSITASPLIMGNDARNISKTSTATLLNAGAIAIDQARTAVLGRY